VIIASLTFGSAGPTFFESLSLLALSAYRVMPAMARVNARMIAMRGQMHLIEAMESGGGSHKNAIPKPQSPLSGGIAMELQGLSARYEGNDKPVFEALHHHFEAG